MKKQPIPVQGYDTQVPTIRPTKRAGSRPKTPKTGAHSPASKDANAHAKMPGGDPESNIAGDASTQGGGAR